MLKCYKFSAGTFFLKELNRHTSLDRTKGFCLGEPWHELVIKDRKSNKWSAKAWQTPFSSHPLSVDARSLRWKTTPGGRRRFTLNRWQNSPFPPWDDQPGSVYCRKSHSRWCPRKWISTKRPCPHTPDGGRRRDKETGGGGGGEKQWHKGWTAKVESGMTGGGELSLYGLIYLFACVCVCVFVGPMQTLAKFVGLTTSIIHIHWLINQPDLTCNTSHFDDNCTYAVQSKAAQTLANLSFVFWVKKVEVSLAKTEGEGASSAEKKRVRKWRTFLHPKKSQWCIPQPVSNMMFFSFLFQSRPMRLPQSECEALTLDRNILYGWQIALSKTEMTPAICAEAGGKQPCFGQGNLTVSVVQEWALEC